MIERPYKQLDKSEVKIHPWLQLLTFIGIFLVVLFAGTFLGLGVTAAFYGLKSAMSVVTMDVKDPHFISALWILQTLGTTLPILIGPLIFARVVVNDIGGYVKPNINFNWGLLPLIFAIMLVSTPLMEYLALLNQKMVLPPWLHWMRDSEDNAQKITGIMLQMKTLWDVTRIVLFVGLLTAIVEEFMFRGVLQTILLKLTKNTHAAVWITAILFSAFHIEFFGFLPRLLLGVFFGYFVAWSGSVWTGVWAHFINNATAVIATYLSENKKIKINPDDQHLFNSSAYIGSFFIALALLLIYQKITSYKKQIPAY